MLTSCYTTNNSVGNASDNEPMVTVKTVKNHHLIYGLVPLKNTEMKDKEVVANHKNYKITKSMTFVDGLLQWLTWGIYTPTTTTYSIPLKDAK